MTKQYKIYIAGPDVFLPNASEVLNQKKDICTKYNMIGLSPMDQFLRLQETYQGLELAQKIYEYDVKLIEDCDIIVANCNPFRLALVDDGTSYEIGHGRAIGKTIYGYVTQKRPLPEIVQSRIPLKVHVSGYLMDQDGYLVNEDFGNTVNLMIEFSIISSGGKLIEGDFEDCIKSIA